MRAHRARRCVLAVPGSNPKMVAKAAGLSVDQVMLDLEDAVAPTAKHDARARVVESLARLDFHEKAVSLRVNDVSTAWFERDVADVVSAAGAVIDTVGLPKVDSADDVLRLASLLDEIERSKGFERRIGIEPQIESARGLCFVEAIAFAHERLESLTFGPADFAASIGSPVLTIGAHRMPYPVHVWHYAMARIAVAAKAADLAAIDGPYGNLKDASGLLESARMARVLGYDGKWAIHPDQIAPITETFTPSSEELERARRITERYAAARDESGGAIAYENELLDAASLRLAEGTLRRAPGKTQD